MLVGEGPVLCVCLAKREAQHVWTGYVRRRGHGNGVEIVRLVHTVEVGSRRTVAVYHHLVACVERTLLRQLLILPAERRLKLHAILIIIYRDGVEIDRSFASASCHNNGCVVGGNSRSVCLLRHVDIHTEVFRHPRAEPLAAGEVYRRRLVKRCAAVVECHAHLSALVVGAHRERDAAHLAALPSFEIEHRLAVARYLVVAVAGGCAKLVLEVNPRVARHHSASRYLKLSRLLVVFHNSVHYFRRVSRNRKRKERRYRHRLTRYIHQIIHILACFLG